MGSKNIMLFSVMVTLITGLSFSQDKLREIDAVRLSDHLYKLMTDPDYTIEKLKKYPEMILSTVAIVKKEIGKEKSRDEMKKENILTGWKEWANGFHSFNEWIEIVYYSLTFTN